MSITTEEFRELSFEFFVLWTVSQDVAVEHLDYSVSVSVGDPGSRKRNRASCVLHRYWISHLELV